MTEQYPEEKKVTAPRFHGRHQLNRHPDGLEKCIGCELCAWACPADAIYVEGADNTDEERFSPGERYGRVYQINYLRCIFCGLCIEACPTRALTMTNEFELADSTRESLIFEKQDLLAPLMPGMVEAPHPMFPGTTSRTTTGAGWPGPRRPRATTPLHTTRTTRATSRTRRDRRDHAGRDCRHRHRRGRPVLAARARRRARRRRDAADPQGGAQRAAARGDDDLPGGFYIAQGASFLGVVQVVVYTGAVMMLFLFVLMLVGVDSADSLVETLRGQRIAALLAGVGFAALVMFGIGDVVMDDKGLEAANADGNVQGLANLIFTRYVFAFEVTSALLITAALGAMVLAHRERIEARLSQRELSELRFRRPNPAPLPGPGVYARHNAVDTPALLPDGTPSELSVSPVLTARGDVRAPVSGGADIREVEGAHDDDGGSQR